MCQEAVRRLCHPSESCHVRKVARLLAQALMFVVAMIPPEDGASLAHTLRGSGRGPSSRRRGESRATRLGTPEALRERPQYSQVLQQTTSSPFLGVKQA